MIWNQYGDCTFDDPSEVVRRFSSRDREGCLFQLLSRTFYHACTLTAAKTSGAPHHATKTDGPHLTNRQKYNLRNVASPCHINHLHLSGLT